MKNLILTIAIITLALSTSLANTNPLDNTGDLETISFEMNDADKIEFSINVSYDLQQESLMIETGEEVSFIQVLNNDGVLQYQLPVFSETVVLDLNDFETGDYSLNLLFENDSMVSSSFSK